MGKLKKQSKRQPARLRYKIEKKVRDHNRKVRKENKNKKPKKSIIQVPNICPFKEQILQEVEVLKKQKEEEKRLRREAARQEKLAKKANEAPDSLEGLLKNALRRDELHQNLTTDNTMEKKQEDNKEKSLKQFFREFRKVVEEADVVLEVLDARDPLGTRCKEVEQAISELNPDKKQVLVLNKADLVPRKILEQWLQYLRRSVPVVAFKASTQQQTKKLGHKKMKKNTFQSSSCIGAELLMSLLGNYCRNKSEITVGVVGLPNVGKSSIINSLKRTRVCNVGATPGVTRHVQKVHLDSKIKLLDSPGIVFASGNDSSSSLKNAVRISSLSDPITPANAILQRVSKKQMMEMYDITEYRTPEEFYSLKAARAGKFKKGGVPDSLAAARMLLEDWNAGKINYYTVPPEDENVVHISSAIVRETKEFDVDQLGKMEVELLDNIEARVGFRKGVAINSSGLFEADEKMEDDNLADEGKTNEEEEENELLSAKTKVDIKKRKRKGKVAVEKKKYEKQLEDAGNLKLNQIKKKQFKKEKKDRRRREKVAQQLSEGLDNISFDVST